jgi:hypothetical protein
MEKTEAVKYFDKCNKIITGSQQIIKAIDEDKEINIKKAIRASMLNSQILAIQMKTLIQYICDNSIENKQSGLPKEFMDMFNMK